MSFSCSEKSLSIPDIQGLWQACLISNKVRQSWLKSHRTTVIMTPKADI